MREDVAGHAAPAPPGGEQVACGLPLPRLSRHPFHGSPGWKPSGIPAAVVVLDHYALVSSGFPTRRSLGGRLAPLVKFALSPGTPFR